MDYSRITDLLGKFSEIINKSDIKKDVVISVLAQFTKKVFKKEDFKIDKDILVLNVSPLVKNEIFIHKEKILNEFKINNINIKNIR
mgnify:FL=1